MAQWSVFSYVIYFTAATSEVSYAKEIVSEAVESDVSYSTTMVFEVINSSDLGGSRTKVRALRLTAPQWGLMRTATLFWGPLRPAAQKYPF